MRMCALFEVVDSLLVKFILFWESLRMRPRNWASQVDAGRDISSKTRYEPRTQ